MTLFKAMNTLTNWVAIKIYIWEKFQYFYNKPIFEPKRQKSSLLDCDKFDCLAYYCREWIRETSKKDEMTMKGIEVQD